jgi:TRAP-type C4-dicarboxylate transport system permease large subunit
VEKSLKHFWPYLIAVFIGLLVLAAVPWFSTFLPAMAGLIPF